MKVGIITINGNYNFGNRLQNYALQHILLKNGYKPNTIWITNKKVLIKTILISFITLFYKKTRVLKFYSFTRKYIKPMYYLNHKKIKYDKIVVGSDQVWNPNFNFFADEYFANFSPYEKNISYAASFGVDEIPLKMKETFKKGLSNFSYISVREQKGKEIITKLGIDKKVKVVLDPTLLLSESEWENVVKPVKIKKKYIFLYFLGTITEIVRKEIVAISLKYDFEIINVLDRDSKYYNIGPAEFLYLIKNSNLVLTDSFHATVFSIIFKKPFFAIERKDNEKKMNSRIVQLVNDFNLQDRYVNKIDNANDIFYVNYSYFEKNILKYRNDSIQYLFDALNDR